MFFTLSRFFGRILWKWRERAKAAVMRGRPVANTTGCQTLNGPIRFHRGDGADPEANHSAACSRLNVPADERLHWIGHSLDVTVSLLWIITPVIATVSVAVVLVAMTTNQWLITQENMANPNYNGSGGAEFLPKATVSGLWRLCHTNREYFFWLYLSRTGEWVGIF